MGVLTRGTFPVVAVVIAAGCAIDFRDGLLCDTSADCDGYACLDGRCSLGNDHVTPSGGATICGVCTPGSKSPCDQSGSPKNTVVECIQINGFDTSPTCRVRVSGGAYGYCEAMIAVTCPSTGCPYYCACPGEIAERGQSCADTSHMVCRNGTSPSTTDLCIGNASAAICRENCSYGTHSCTSGYTCTQTSGGSACVP